MYTIMDNVETKHLWNYTLMLSIFLMVILSPFSLFMLYAPLISLINGMFFIIWLSIYNLTTILIIIVYSAFVKVNSRHLKYSVLGTFLLLFLYPVVIFYNCTKYFRCSMYVLAMLSGYTHGVFYISLIKFLKNSKFTAKNTWPAFLFVDLPSTLLFLVTYKSIIPHGYKLMFWIFCAIMAFVTLLIFLFILRIERYERSLMVTSCERKIMEEIVLERRLSNCSDNLTEIPIRDINNGLFHRINFCTDTVNISYNLLLIVFTSTLTSCLPTQTLFFASNDHHIFAIILVSNGIFRLLYLTLPFIPKYIALTDKSADALLLFSLVHTSMPILVTIFTDHQVLFYVFLSMSLIINSIVICGSLYNLPAFLPPKASTSEKNSTIILVVITSILGHTFGNLLSYIIHILHPVKYNGWGFKVV